MGQLNEAIESGRIREVILVSEALHEQRVVEIAVKIAAAHAQVARADRDRVRLVLIAGPSSSGKTTFSKRLAIQLLAHGLRPVPIEMDNYFVDRSRTPRDEKGDYDFEHLHALDLPLFNEHLTALLEGREVRLPRFDFQTGTRAEGERLRVGPEQILIVEGIHGMNPELVSDVPRRVHLSRLYLGPDPAQHRPSQPHLDHRHTPAAAHRARCPVSRLFGGSRRSTAGQSVRRGEATLGLSLPRERG